MFQKRPVTMTSLQIHYPSTTSHFIFSHIVSNHSFLLVMAVTVEKSLLSFFAVQSVETRNTKVPIIPDLNFVFLLHQLLLFSLSRSPLTVFFLAEEFFLLQKLFFFPHLNQVFRQKSEIGIMCCS